MAPSLPSAYAAGLRLSEAVRLKVADIDSERMVIPVALGKGQKDRYVMLSPKLLQILRAWWPVHRPSSNPLPTTAEFCQELPLLRRLRHRRSSRARMIGQKTSH